MLAAGLCCGQTPQLQFGGPEICCDGLPTPLSFDEFSHITLDHLLHHYVDTGGKVCYGDWSRCPQDILALEEYLLTLGTVDPNLPASQEARMAFYINAYNALTLRGILQEYPIVSIQRITKKIAVTTSSTTSKFGPPDSISRSIRSRMMCFVRSAIQGFTLRSFVLLKDARYC